jgi:lycopene beta-cyclase
MLKANMTKLLYRTRQFVLVALWCLVLVSLPLARWALGDEMLRNGIAAGVVAQAAAVVWLLAQACGWRRAALTALGVLALSWLSELAGSSLKFPFGQYHYTVALQPQLLGVPLLIPAAWLMMLPPAWAAASAWLGRSARSRLAFALVSAAALTAWDFLLDPQMVAWGFWVWESPGGYFGIPWINFGGWMLISALLSFFLGRVDLPAGPLLLIYGLIWSLQSLGQALFWGQPGPALVGFVLMGAILVGALWRSGRLKHPFSIGQP